MYTISFHLQRPIMIFLSTAICNLVAKRKWHLLHGLVQFLIVCFVQNLRMARFRRLHICQGRRPGRRNWKAWAVVRNVWLGRERERVKNTPKQNLLQSNVLTSVYNIKQLKLFKISKRCSQIGIRILISA